MRTKPFSILFGGASALVLGTLCRYRVLPFLKDDTILSGGKRVPTAEMAAMFERMFYAFGAACIIGSLIWFAAQARRGKA
jgi:hypothetical protein